MALLTGPIQSASTSPFANQLLPGVNLWWPDDRAWCVGTDIDLMTTYVGASRLAIASLLGDGSIEALAVSVDQLVTWDADTINPLPAPP